MALRACEEGIQKLRSTLLKIGYDGDILETNSDEVTNARRQLHRVYSL